MAEFKEVMKKYNEMCNEIGCRDCPMTKLKYEHNCISCLQVIDKCHEEAEEVIMGWEKPIDWTKVEVDTKVFVRDNINDGWLRRHFARYEDGKIKTWAEGGTSWSCENEIVAWNYAMLAGEEDI